MPVLIDTSAWVEALRRKGETRTREAVRAALVEGEARLCELVVLELWNGARGQAEAALLRSLESDVDKLSFTPAVWQRAFRLARRLRAAGVTVPASDIAIAACALEHGVELLHRDEDFERIAAAGKLK